MFLYIVLNRKIIYLPGPIENISTKLTKKLTLKVKEELNDLLPFPLF